MALVASAPDAPRSEEILVDGLVEFPLVNPDEIAVQAWAAMTRQDADEALRLWEALRQDFPERPDGFIWPIQIMWQNGRLEEADVMAAAAFARFPENPNVLVQHAWIAMARQRWDEALQWWTAVRTHAPEQLEGYLWAARALWQAARLDEADAMAAEALERFPGNTNVQAECAWIAVNRGDWEGALLRWRLVLEAEPERRDAQIGLIQAMRWTGQIDEAEALAAELLDRRPDDPDLLIEHLWAAVNRGDQPVAAARLAAARDRLQAVGRFEETRRAIAPQMPTVAEATNRETAPPRRRMAEALAAPATADLMLAFESLGERCDFGAVQRHYGVEPLGLLRFAYSPFDALIAALEDRLAAVGTVEDTGFEKWQDETILIMKKYGLVFHTFVSDKNLATPEKRDAFREQQRRRLMFLKCKLVTDLEEPQKIYIYATGERTADEDAARLFAALRGYGPNSLLYVRPAAEPLRLGRVERLKDGLYAGYYPGLVDFLKEEQPPFELWRQLCERTYRLVQSRSRRPRPRR
jgi:tetratricopeptide (TPR) repeat protein